MRKTVLALLFASLAACLGEPTVPEPAADEPAVHMPPAAAPDQPAEDVPPATAPAGADVKPAAGAPQADGDDQARFDGYGDLKLGMQAEAMERAWGGELARVGPEGERCYYKTPKWVKVPAEFAFMVEDGRFVRYSTESDRFVAPGGGKVGMVRARIERLYPGRIEEQPHKYVEGGKMLRIADPASGNALLFELDAAGKVSQWRVGQPPQVDYVEGCA